MGESQKCTEEDSKSWMHVAMVSEDFIQARKSAFYVRAMPEMLLWWPAKWTEASSSEANTVDTK